MEMYSGVYNGAGNTTNPSAPPPSYEEVMRTSQLNVSLPQTSFEQVIKVPPTNNQQQAPSRGIYYMYNLHHLAKKINVFEISVPTEEIVLNVPTLESCRRLQNHSNQNQPPLTYNDICFFSGNCFSMSFYLTFSICVMITIIMIIYSLVKIFFCNDC